MTTPEDPADVLGSDPPGGGDPSARAAPSEMRLKPEQLHAPPEECRYTPASIFDDMFAPGPLATPLAADGLPDHSLDGDGSTAIAAPFAYDTVTCIEDARKWVALDLEELLASGAELLPPGAVRYDNLCRVELSVREVIQQALGRELVPITLPTGGPLKRGSSRLFVANTSRYDAAGKLRSERAEFEPSKVVSRFGYDVVEIDVPESAQDRLQSMDPRELLLWLFVKPRRPRCIHYKRQHFSNDDEVDPKMPGHNIIFRDCVHPCRRSIGGAAMSLSDQAVYGCDFRDPPAPNDLKWLDERDARVLREEPHKVHIPLFGRPGDDIDERTQDHDDDGPESDSADA